MGYRVIFGFKVSRKVGPIPANELQRQIEVVLGILQADETISGLALTADLEQASLELEVGIDAESDQQAEQRASALVASAIRTSGGTHLGLLSMKEEMAFGPRGLTAISGLRQHQWRRRMVELEST